MGNCNMGAAHSSSSDPATAAKSVVRAPLFAGCGAILRASPPPSPPRARAPAPFRAQVVSPGSGANGAVRRNAGHAATLQSTAYPDVRTCHESFRRGARVSAAQPCYGTRTIGADGKVRRARGRGARRGARAA